MQVGPPRLQIGGVHKLLWGSRRGLRLFFRRMMPSSRRCKGCWAPFEGPFSVPFQIIRIRPSRKNPQLCTMCYEFSPLGGEVATLSVMFVDVRGFTSLSERLPPNEVVARLNRFYKLATRAVVDLDGTVDKMVGDQVMAFFGTPFRADNHPQRAVQAALEIVSGVETMNEDSDSLRVGGGVGTGEAYVGNIAEGEVKDFTVIGDVVNTAARLQGEAQPGEVLLMKETYRQVAGQFPNAPQRTLDLKGKAAPVVAHVLQASSIRR